MKNENEQFLNKDEELEHYKLKYLKNKEKYKIFKELQAKSRLDFSELKLKYLEVQDNFEKEKSLRKKFEQKILTLMKSENQRISNPHNSNNQIKFQINSNEKSFTIDNMNDENYFRSNSNMTITSNTASDQYLRDSNLNSTDLKEKTLKEITSKYDVEKLKKSLTVGFIEYEKDSLNLRKKIYSKEDKFIKFEKILKLWTDISDNLKKSIDNVISTMGNFSDNLLIEIEVFEECPDLISLIYTLQTCINDIANQFKFFSGTLENSFLNQIKNYYTSGLNELKETKQIMLKYENEYVNVLYKLQNTKKSYVKDFMKDNCFSANKLYEFSRYDYINKINLGLIFIKVDLPEKVSLLIYSLIVNISCIYDYYSKFTIISFFLGFVQAR